jgi:hypothetical protein
MSEVVSRRTLTADIWFRFEIITYEIWSGKLWHYNRFLFEYFSSTLSVLFHTRSVLILI